MTSPAVRHAPPLWVELAARAGLALSPEQIDRLHRHLDLLLAANARMNLTRVTDRADAETRHVADALTLLPHLPAGAFTLADLGSGGGVPGLCLAVARPAAAVSLIESTGKKAAFLADAARALELTNVKVLRARAEEVGRSRARGTFDVVTSRAAGALPWLVEWSLPLLRPTGRLLAMKGERHAEELAASAAALRLLGAADPVVHPVDPMGGATGGVIIDIRKLRPTPDAFPRPAPEAKGRPLVER